MKKLIIYGIVGASLLFGSCSKSFLHYNPTDDTAKETALSSVPNAEKALKGMHKRLFAFSSNGFSGEPTFALYGDILGSNIVKNSNSSGWYRNVYNLSDMEDFKSDLSYYPWRFRYIMIKNANEMLSKIDEIEPNTESEKAQKANIKAQTLTYRAYHYYQLATYYASRWIPNAENNQLAVPLRLEPNGVSLPRETVSNVYAQVIKDADEAIALFNGDGNKFKRTERNNLSVDAAYMVKARVYMIQHNFEQALEMAKKVISSPANYKIMGIDKYSEGFSKGVVGNNVEWIWGSKITTLNESGWGSFYAYASCDFSATYTSAGPHAINSAVYKYIKPTDKRLSLFLADDEATIKEKGNAYYFDNKWIAKKGATVRQYMSKKFQTASGGADTSGDMVYMRLAETYYIAAEAAYMLGLNTEAATYLKATITPYDATYVAPQGEELLTAIKMYKQFDLFSEGRSWEDYKRRGEVVNRENTNHDVVYAKVMKYQADGENAYAFVVPVPRKAMEANPLLVQ